MCDVWALAIQISGEAIKTQKELVLGETVATFII
jgi:hypothetical protein